MDVNNTSIVASPPSFKRNVVPDDSFTSSRKDSTDNSISTTLVEDTHQSSAVMAPMQSRKLFSGVLPVEIRALLDQWYLRRGLDQPPPCTQSDSDLRMVLTSDDGKPARYEHKNGEKLEVMVYTLQELAIRFKEKYITVVQGPTQGPFIISYQKGTYASNSVVPYFVWKGLDTDDPLGWESKASIRKVIMPMTPAWSGRDTEPEVLGHNNVAMDSDGDTEVGETGAHIKAEEDAQPDCALEGDWQQSPEPELILTPIPKEIRTLLNRWYSHRGSKQPPPCAVDFATVKDLDSSEAGSDCMFTHRESGTKLTISACVLPELANGHAKEKYVIIAERPGFAPHIIGSPFASTTSYHIWEGLDALAPTGWALQASIYRNVCSHNSGTRKAQGEVADFAGEDGLGDADRGSISHFSEHQAEVSSSTKPEKNGALRTQEISHAAKVEHVADENPMPESIQKLLNEWCDQPGHNLESLPCATSTPYYNIFRTSGGRPVVWEHVSGEKLKINMYPLEGAHLKDGGQKKIVVAQGPSLKPCIISYCRRGDQSEAVTYRIWYGVGGDRDGFEKGCSVKKIFLPMNKKALKPALPSDSVRVSKRESLPIFKKAETDERSVDVDPSTRKRKRPYDELDPSLIISQSPTKHLRTRERDSDALPRPLPSAVKKHIQNNAVLLFYSQSSKTPRVRLFAACNTVQKLFAQALAADLFDDSGAGGSKGGGSGGKVLTIRFGGVRKATETSKNVLVVEDDEEDFEALVGAIEARDWWVTGRSGGLVEGSGTVEVMAKG